MAVTIRGGADDALITIRDVLTDYVRLHPDAEIDLYRRNAVSVRVRVIDPGFQGLRKPERHAAVWHHLASLPEDLREDFSMIVTLAPDEVDTSHANLEFEHPTASLIA